MLSENARVPSKATNGSAAYDLFSCEDVRIPIGSIHKIRLGIAVEIPREYFIYIRPRSGLAANHGGDMCSSGIVDSDYRGEIFMPIVNHGEDVLMIGIGYRVGQMVLLPVLPTEIVLVNELNPSLRGDGGFGSTGR